MQDRTLDAVTQLLTTLLSYGFGEKTAPNYGPIRVFFFLFFISECGTADGTGTQLQTLLPQAGSSVFSSCQRRLALVIFAEKYIIYSMLVAQSMYYLYVSFVNLSSDS